MKRIVLMVILVANFAHAQENITRFYIETKANTFFQLGSKRYFETGISGGLKLKQHFCFGMSGTYNFTTSKLSKELDELENLKYFNLHADVSYSFLSNKRISPVLNLSFGTGLHSKNNDLIQLDDEGTPLILNDPSNFAGYYRRNKFQTSLMILTEFYVTKKIVFNIGAGYQLRIIKKTDSKYYKKDQIIKYGWTLNAGLKYIF